MKLCQMLNAENSQKVLYFFKLSHFLQADPAHFFFAMDAAAEAFFKAPFLFGDHLMELSFVFGSKLFECIFPIPGQLQ